MSLSLLACKTNKEAKKAVSFAEDEVIMYLSKGPCFGRCPIYQLNIYGNGLAEFKGERFTDKLGTFHKTLDKDVFNTLKSTFEASDFQTFDYMYDSRLPDLPLITVGYKALDTLQLSKGRENRPESLESLQALLENVAEGDGWTLVEALNVDNMEVGDEGEVQVDKSRIVIQMQGMVKLPIWFKEKRDQYGVRILERMDEDKREWLITYDTTMIEGDALIKALQEDESISYADYEANYKKQ